MQNTRRVSEIIPDALAQFTTLLRKERQLLGAEIAEKTRRAAIGLLLLAAAGLLLILGFCLLLLAGVAALIAYGVASYFAALMVAVVVFLVSIILLMVGISRLKSKNLMLGKTASQLRQDVSLAKRQLRPGDAFDKTA